MERHIDSFSLIPDRSYAFRKNSSTAHCINDVINNTANLKAKGFNVIAAILFQF